MLPCASGGWRREPQFAPLRYAPVGMTIHIWVRDASTQERLSSENKVTNSRDDKGEGDASIAFVGWWREPQVPIRLRSGQALHFAPPDFLWNLVASANFMRLSLRKGAHAALSSAAWQEIRVRFGRDDNSYFGKGCECPRKIVIPIRKMIKVQLFPGALKRSSPRMNAGAPTKKLQLPSWVLTQARLPARPCRGLLAVIAKIAKAGCWPFSLQRRFKSLWGSTGTDHSSSW